MCNWLDIQILYMYQSISSILVYLEEVSVEIEIVKTTYMWNENTDVLCRK